MSAATVPTSDPHDVSTLPYRVAVLCYLYDERGRLLLLHRKKEPNTHMYSPIGGKLEVQIGESPHQCALREIFEESELLLRADELRLAGIVSEKAYQGKHHWLIFLFEVTRPIQSGEITRTVFDEGTLEWHAVDDVDRLPIPETDKRVMWPNVKKHRGGFFMVHIDCAQPDAGSSFRYTIDESWPS
ncbi:MAG: NUDIX domain-containing protein [Phycisphaerae bacterium]|nr:NUDIX domain-containing protein [Phycisphaerae bacterium]